MRKLLFAILICLILPLQTHAAICDSLVSYYNFSSSSLDSVDSNTGSDSGSPTYQTYNGDPSVYFSGSSYINLGTPSNLNFSGTGKPFSISSWIYLTVYGGPYQIVSKGYDGSHTQYQFYWSYSYLVFNCYGGGSVTGTHAFSTGAWHHVVAVYDGTTWYLYLDGALDNSATGAAPVGTAERVMIGAVDISGSPGQNFVGYIGPTGIWARALSSSDVTTLYNGGTPLTYSFCGGGTTTTIPAYQYMFKLMR